LLPKEEDRSAALSKASTCALLAPAGAPRTRLLAQVYKDPRAANDTSFSLLKAMLLGRLVRPAETESFAAKLEAHHCAVDGSGTTILERAVVQHNLVAAARVYDNIAFADLGALLFIPSEKAERIAAQMIAEGRLAGTLDQVSGTLHFTGSRAGLFFPSLSLLSVSSPRCFAAGEHSPVRDRALGLGHHGPLRAGEPRRVRHRSGAPGLARRPSLKEGPVEIFLYELYAPPCPAAPRGQPAPRREGREGGREGRE
jgi:hypothetical protein